MTKSPEEGRIWEWRAFGQVSERLAAQVRAYPIRLGISDLRGEDLYLVSPQSNQNVKLRRYSGGWLLKFKLLLETRPGGFELYNESAEFSYRFPVTPEEVKEAARLLAVVLPEAVLLTSSFNENEFVKALQDSSPAVAAIRTFKRRSQYQVEGGWLELADVQFTKRIIQSLSIHSPDLAAVKKHLKLLQPGAELEPLNYIDACRRWG